MNKLVFLVAFSCATSCLPSAFAQVTMQPLLSFGGGDGWLAPAESNMAGGAPNPYLGTANNERGIAYSPTTGHLYLVSRGSGLSVRILNSQTAQDLGELPIDTAVVNGGTFVLDMIATGTDGVIYAANLANTAGSAPFKVYRWNTETSQPTIAFSSSVLLNTERLGDSFDAFGSGASTRLVAGFGTNAAISGTNSYALIDPIQGSAKAITFPAGTEPATGDFRLGITFTDRDTVIGAQNASVRLTDFDEATGAGTLRATLALRNGLERPMDYAIVGGKPLLATIEVASTSTNTVHVYDLTNESAPVEVAFGNTTTGAVIANANGTGQVRWGAVNGLTATLYAMSTNNGIEAFLVTVPEPSVAALLGVAIGGLLLRRRR